MKSVSNDRMPATDRSSRPVGDPFHSDVVLVDWNMPVMDVGVCKSPARRRTRLQLGGPMVTTETEPEQMLRPFRRAWIILDEIPVQKKAFIDKLRLVGVVN